MKSIWNETIRENIISRLNQLDSQTQPLWGQASCKNMLAHLADSLRMSLGKLNVELKRTPLSYWPINQLMVYWIPIPKGVPTSPELIARQAESIETEKELIIELLNEFASQQGKIKSFLHPAFGRLSEKALGVLTYKHMEHHCKQFGR